MSTITSYAVAAHGGRTKDFVLAALNTPGSAVGFEVEAEDGHKLWIIFTPYSFANGTAGSTMIVGLTVNDLTERTVNLEFPFSSGQDATLTINESHAHA